MDGYTQYTTVYPLKPKEAPEINPAMQRYIEWAYRLFRAFKVTKVITNSGREFNNEEMTN
ncbi:Hypothetical protein PHPALM_36462 [Phytophthora palmivora]|uniref:Uncharacterized protein n=1 Tax=Phytophthora palmivora TaxID=4796 RepID=A0A2P4WZW1_9STRA|nr:Hypothetical protein PHPALM_36462 [Phytophthora palmivora]